MALDFTITTTEHSYFPGNQPTADNIYNVMQAVQLPAGARWVGPLPGITRGVETGFKKWTTYVMWPLEIAAPFTQEGAQMLADQVATAVSAALAPLSSDWSPAVATTYDPATLGPLEQWTNGTAAIPHTLHPENNALEDITSDGYAFEQHAGTAIQAAGTDVSNLATNASHWILPAALIAGGGVAVYLAWPLLMGARSAASKALR